MAGGHDSERQGTPRGELTRIRESREQRAERVRTSILEAMLAACGERGYRSVAVQDVIDRYGGNRVQFYRHFASKADCYAEAYEAEADLLSERILSVAGAASCWRLGLRAGLEELAAFAEREPLLARGLLVEVHIAGGPALKKRSAVCARLAEALDGGRREAAADRPPPSITARFMVGAIESSVSGALLAGDPRAFARAIPGLAHMVVSAYLGEDAAGEELAAATAA